MKSSKLTLPRLPRRYMKSLNALNSTDVIVLFATNVASVYLLSWVILHEQFVGVRVIAPPSVRLVENSPSLPDVYRLWR